MGPDPLLWSVRNMWTVMTYYDLLPWRLTWNLQTIHLERKMIFQTSMIMFHVNLQGCIIYKLITGIFELLWLLSIYCLLVSSFTSWPAFANPCLLFFYPPFSWSVCIGTINYKNVVIIVICFNYIVISICIYMHHLYIPDTTWISKTIMHALNIVCLRLKQSQAAANRVVKRWNVRSPHLDFNHSKDGNGGGPQIYIPSRKLTYPIPRHFWRSSSFSKRGIC